MSQRSRSPESEGPPAGASPADAAPELPDSASLRPSPRVLLGVRVALVFNLTVLTWASHRPGLTMPGQDAFVFGLDKWGHVATYAFLTLLFLAARLFERADATASTDPTRDDAGRAARRPLPDKRGPGDGGRAPRTARSMTLSLLLLVLYMALAEWTQQFVGRESSWMDLLASTIGVVAGLGIWAGVDWLGRPARSFVDHAKVMSALTLLSRGFGLLRDWAVGWLFGLGAVGDAFDLAFTIPNLFRRLFGEGALAAAFIPQYTRLRQPPPDETAADAAADDRPAGQLAGMVVYVLLMTLLVVAAVGSLLIGGLLLAGWLDERGTLTAKLTLVTIWYMPAVCTAAILAAVMQVHGRFGVPSALPVLLNLLIIGSAVLAGLLGEALALPQRAFIVAGAVALAGGLQVAWLLSAMRGAGIRLHRGGRGEPTVRQAGRRLLVQWGPTALGLAVFQLNALADKLIAMIFSGGAGDPMQAGAVIALGLASRLYEFPLGVFGIAVATAIFPALAAATADPVRLKSLVQQGIRLTLFIGVPATVGLILVRGPLCTAIYDEAGQLDASAAMRIAAILLGYAPAVWAYALNHLLIRTFYAHEDTITPMKVSLAMVGLNLPLNLVLIWPLGAAGLAASTAICAALQALILSILVRRYVSRPLDRALGRGVGMTLLASAVMAGAVIIVQLLIQRGVGLDADARGGALALLAAMVATGVATFLALARLMNMAELRWLRRRSVDESTP